MTDLMKPKRRKASLEARKARSGYVFVLPFLLGIVLIYLPILLDSIWFSFNSLVYDTTIGEWVLKYEGISFYKNALMVDEKFVPALLSGIQQLIFEVPAIIIFSLFIAVVLNQKMLGRAAFRAIFFVPVIIATGLMESINATDIMSDVTEGGIDDGSGPGNGSSGIISALDVEKLFEGMKIGGGLVDYVVELVNNVYNIINYSGVQMLIFLSGLQSISPSIYEACQIEGATGWETFWKITFPMISPMILVNAVYTIIDSFTRTTNPAMSYISKISGQHEATAMAWIYFSIVMLIIAVVAGIASTFVFYQRRD
jgi:ABC-type sugar transport system permease subunit